MQMGLSMVLIFLQRNDQLKKSDKILLIISAVPDGKFCSLDFICENAMEENYDPEVHKVFRGTVSAALSYLDTHELIEKRTIPFDPKEREEFAQERIWGTIIDRGPRKTKDVYRLSKKGQDLAQKIQTQNNGDCDGRIKKNNQLHPGKKSL